MREIQSILLKIINDYSLLYKRSLKVGIVGGPGSHDNQLFFIMQTIQNDNKQKFNITFQFEYRSHRASVTKVVIGSHTIYTIYPLSAQIIRRFGTRLCLYKENGKFSMNASESEYEAYKEYVNQLTSALQAQDRQH